MDIYSLALFMHILGVIAFFMALGVYAFGLVALRRATQVQQVRVICQVIFATDAVAVGGIVLVAAAGVYMAVTTWGLTTGWVIVAIISFASLAPLGPLIIERRLHRIAALAEESPDGPLSPQLQQRLADPVIGAALFLLLALLLGIIYLMTTKPALVSSILAMVIAPVVGLIAGIPFWLARERKARTEVVSGSLPAE